MPPVPIDDQTEWLEADGRGGFASGTTAGIRTRRYHALLLPATTPPTGRMALVNGFDAFVETADGSVALSAQRYAPGVVHPDGASRVRSFVPGPWPTWEYALPDGACIRQELFLDRQESACWIAWTLVTAGDASTLHVRPFMSGRDYHAMHRENTAFRFDVERSGAACEWRPYEGVPPVTIESDGEYRHDPQWYRNFLYAAERERGLDDTEDLASPGTFSWRLSSTHPRAVLCLRARAADAVVRQNEVSAAFERARDRERARRDAFATPLDRAADGYLVERGAGRTLVAGYPWFTDWGRDTFIAMRGLCLATGRFSEARDILLEWAGAVSEGMLPNRFPDRGEHPEFNSVDASLWFVVAVGELLRAAGAQLDDTQHRSLASAVREIVDGYAAGTRYGIRMDADGLLAAGAPGQQLTWMDARVGNREITPRIGKPVEIQALWYNAVAVAAEMEARWRPWTGRIQEAFVTRFWNEATGTLADVVDVDHVAGTRDDSLRPNQILALGGLPLALVAGSRARRIINTVEAELLTPMGLRSLARSHPAYTRRYTGGPDARDAAYHQGTVWPWLLGPFVEAWVRSRGNTTQARIRARRRFLEPLFRHLGTSGLWHLPEITDAEAPFTPRGCPFQAWSLGEYLRLDRHVLSTSAPTECPTAEVACV